MEAPPAQLGHFYAVLEGPLVPYLDRASRIQLAATCTASLACIMRDSRSTLRPLSLYLDDITYLDFLHDEASIKQDLLPHLRALSRGIQPGEPNCSGTLDYESFAINAGDVHALLAALTASSDEDLLLLVRPDSTGRNLVMLREMLWRAARASAGPLRLHKLALRDLTGCWTPLPCVERLLGLPGLANSLRELYLEGLVFAQDRDEDRAEPPDDGESDPDGSRTIDGGSLAQPGAASLGPGLERRRDADALVALLRGAEGLTRVTLQRMWLSSTTWRRNFGALARHRRPLRELHIEFDSVGDAEGFPVEELVELVHTRRIDELRLIGVHQGAPDAVPRLLARGSKATRMAVHPGSETIALFPQDLEDLLAPEVASAMRKALMTNDVLTHLNLSACGLRDEAAIAFALDDASDSSNATLTSLHLGGNEITMDACPALVKGLRSFRALTHLDMEATELEFLGVATLLDGLPSLRVAGFANLACGEFGVREFGEAIGRNNTLEALKLGGRHPPCPGEEGFSMIVSAGRRVSYFHPEYFVPGLAAALGAGLARNTKLEKLHLEVFDFEEDGDPEALIDGLMRNATLRHLSLLNYAGISVFGTPNMIDLAYALSWLGSDSSRSESSPPVEMSLRIHGSVTMMEELRPWDSEDLHYQWEIEVKNRGAPPHNFATLSFLHGYPDEFRSQLPWKVLSPEHCQWA